jgi:hypothetical protein
VILIVTPTFLVVLESGTKVGEATPRAPRVRRLVEAGVPAVKVAGELVVEDARADLQQKVGAARCPAHLLLPGHALADDLVDR